MALTLVMADVPLSHLSRPQLVQLLVRIVDLLSQPAPSVQTVQTAAEPLRGGGLELYDASLDPWNAPDEAPAAPSAAPAAPRDQVMPIRRGSRFWVQGPLNPAASAFYPVVSGPPASHPQPGYLSIPPGLPQFGADRLGSLPDPVSSDNRVAPSSTVSTENALPGCGPWVHACGHSCRGCGAPCCLVRSGHTAHLCEIHKIP